MQRFRLFLGQCGLNIHLSFLDKANHSVHFLPPDYRLNLKRKDMEKDNVEKATYSKIEGESAAGF